MNAIWQSRVTSCCKYDRIGKMVIFDRSQSGNTFHPEFPSIERAPAELVDGRLKLRVFIDHSIVEVFINGGEAVIINQIFPTGVSGQLETFSEMEAQKLPFQHGT